MGLRGQYGNWISLVCQVLESEPTGAHEGKDLALYSWVYVLYGVSNWGLLRQFLHSLLFP